MKTAAALALVALLLAGCANAPAAERTEAPLASASNAVTLVAPTFRAPLVLGVAGPDGAEPNIAVTMDDHVFVTNSPSLWRSVDGGATFAATARGALDASGDMDLASDARGTLYYAGLVGKSGTLPFQVSRDDGASWSASVDLANGNRTDREWIDALPNGTVYVTWRDFGSPNDAKPASHLMFRRSPDGGATWDPIMMLGNDDLEGPIAHDPRDGAKLFVALHENGIQVARSADAGGSWSFANVTHEAPDHKINGNPTSIHIVTAVDAAGNVYVVWSDDPSAPTVAGGKDFWVPSVKMVVSRDGGVSWSAPLVVSSPDRAAVMPWIVAGKAGRVAVAYYENEHGLPNEHAPDAWNVLLAESVDADAAKPTFVHAKANVEPVHVGAICTMGGRCDRAACVDPLQNLPVDDCLRTRPCFTSAARACAGRDRSRLDLFEMALRPNGQPILAWTQDADASSGADRSVRIVVGAVENGTPIG